LTMLRHLILLSAAAAVLVLCTPGGKNSLCPDTRYSCPGDQTCCAGSTSGQWTCCPLNAATCCTDHVHCCPHDT
ncbi:hypothetical protein PFISCL1PPCAC_22690, partial [Pristionchus fissidentatus]